MEKLKELTGIDLRDAMKTGHILQVYVDGATVKRLIKQSAELGRSAEELAESAVSEKALDMELGR